jgi:hypothetical protein
LQGIKEDPDHIDPKSWDPLVKELDELSAQTLGAAEAVELERRVRDEI